MTCRHYIFFSQNTYPKTFQPVSRPPGATRTGGTPRKSARIIPAAQRCADGVPERGPQGKAKPGRVSLFSCFGFRVAQTTYKQKRKKKMLAIIWLPLVNQCKCNTCCPQRHRISLPIPRAMAMSWAPLRGSAARVLATAEPQAKELVSTRLGRLWLAQREGDNQSCIFFFFFFFFLPPCHDLGGVVMMGWRWHLCPILFCHRNPSMASQH